VRATSIRNTQLDLVSQNITSQKKAMHGLARRLVLQQLSTLAFGRLVIEDHGDVFEFGEDADKTGLVAHIVVHHISAYHDVMLNGTVGSGEAYMRGAWSTPDLVKVIRIFVRNMALMSQWDSKKPLWQRMAMKLLHWANSNHLTGSRRNISAHYDLGNDFFEQFLDPTMMYSSAIYPHPEATLEQAQRFKLDRICRKLQLRPDDHIIEIGTGWGGFALHAASHFGCRVTTTTLSREQFDHTRARVDAAGLGDRITVLLQDYRELEGHYDKLVSIEMIEAVGAKFFPQYFAKCSALLKPHGMGLIQAITISDQRYQQALKEVDFIQRYIFPGGCLPCNAVLAQHVASDTDMQIVHWEDITVHYARTLAQWREGFWNRINAIQTKGYHDVFVRMWDFYLAYCEGGFAERAIHTSQLVFAKPEAGHWQLEFAAS
jgi:cyclopropane-fatty-acyl-phospholipid synthase